jgi:hypothetical protein
MPDQVRHDGKGAFIDRLYIENDRLGIHRNDFEENGKRGVVIH